MISSLASRATGTRDRCPPVGRLAEFFVEPYFNLLPHFPQ
jgi:hypothetical protein